MRSQRPFITILSLLLLSPPFPSQLSTPIEGAFTLLSSGTNRTAQAASDLFRDANTSNLFVTGSTFPSPEDAGGAWGVEDPETFAGLGSEDIFTARYDADGVEQWVVRTGTPESDLAASVVQREGGVFVCGMTRGQMGPAQPHEGLEDIFILRYSVDGTRAWSSQFGTAGDERCTDIKISPRGSMYITGYTDGDLFIGRKQGVFNLFIAEIFTTDGSLRSSTQVDAGTGYTYGSAIAFDASGNIYVSGYSEHIDSALEFIPDPLVYKFDRLQGFIREVWRYNPISSDQYFLRAIAVGGPNIRVFASGEVRTSNAQGFEPVTISLDRDSGNLVFERSLSNGQATALAESAYAISVLPNGNLYVAGVSDSAVASNRASNAAGFFAVYDDVGGVRYVRQINPAEFNASGFRGLQIDPDTLQPLFAGYTIDRSGEEPSQSLLATFGVPFEFRADVGYTPSPVPTPSPAVDIGTGPITVDPENDFPVGALVGGILGGLAAIVLIGLLARRSCKHVNKEELEEEEEERIEMIGKVPDNYNQDDLM
mmetsp:Transcript_10719/g.26905  ORF Transcript_10719/g.26905 Transcript_10719/m.26905 type:complete len:539 (+) Transcript_10719:135-1751(+)